MNKKIMIAGPVLLLVVAGVGYKMVLAPKPVPVKKKIEGTLVALSPEFIINLSGGRYAKLSVSVLSTVPPVASTDGSPGKLDQNSAIGSVITDDLTGIAAEQLVGKAARTTLLLQIVKDLKKNTDEKITRIFFTDIAVQ